MGEVLAIMIADPGMADELPDAPGYVKAEVVHAWQGEGASLLEDVLDRRLHVGLNLDDVTSELIATVADVMGQTLGWSEAKTRNAVAAYKPSGAERV